MGATAQRSQQERSYVARSYWSSSQLRGAPTWRALSPGDSVKAHYDAHERRAAQRLLYRQARRAQKAAARLAGGDSAFAPKVQVQIAALYCENFPARVAAQAAVGHTAFLEFRARAGDATLGSAVKEYLNDPTAADGLDVDPKVYKQIATAAASAVRARLVFEELGRDASMNEVETYRLFCAAEQSTHLASVPEILRAAVIYGDLLPETSLLGLHPFTALMLEDLIQVSDTYFAFLGNMSVERHPQVVLHWVKALSLTLAERIDRAGSDAVAGPYNPRLSPSEQRFANKPQPRSDVSVPPLAAPPEPTLEPLSPLQRAMAPLAEAAKHLDDSSPLKQLAAGPQALLKTLEQSKQRDGWADIHPDAVRDGFGADPFSAGPVEGDPMEGHELDLYVEGSGRLTGEIFDKTLEASDHAQEEYEALLRDASPVATSLRKLTYLNLEQQPEIERFHTTGSLDGARLPMSDVSECVFKRCRVQERVDRRGSPVLCILSDSSGSVTAQVMKAVKLLTAAWMMATKGSRVQVMAGLYNTGSVRRGVSGPILHWLCHPHKAPQSHQGEALRALAAAPQAGSGSQADALSLHHAINEAQRVARGRHVYVVHICDGSWIQSFGRGVAPAREIAEVIAKLRLELGERLHVSMVLVGNKPDDEATRAADLVLRMEPAAFSEPGVVIQQINDALGPVMRERNRRAARG